MDAKQKAVIRAAKAVGVKMAPQALRTQTQAFLAQTNALKQAGTKQELLSAVGKLKQIINSSNQIDGDAAVGEIFRNFANQAVRALTFAAKIVDRRESTPGFNSLWGNFQRNMAEALSILE